MLGSIFGKEISDVHISVGATIIGHFQEQKVDFIVSKGKKLFLFSTRPLVFKTYDIYTYILKSCFDSIDNIVNKSLTTYAKPFAVLRRRLLYF